MVIVVDEREDSTEIELATGHCNHEHPRCSPDCDPQLVTLEGVGTRILCRPCRKEFFGVSS